MFKFSNADMSELVQGSPTMPQTAAPPSACPLCLDPFTQPTKTACGHEFCTACLAQWTQRTPSCPLCRTALRTSDDPAVPPRRPHCRSLRERIEREEAERAGIRERHRQLANRIALVQSTVFTPSGRPFESLPRVSVAQLRELDKANRRGLGVSLRDVGNGLSNGLV